MGGSRCGHRGELDRCVLHCALHEGFLESTLRFILVRTSFSLPSGAATIFLGAAILRVIG